MARFPDDAVSGLLGSQGRGVEPPAGVAELAFHVCIEIFIAIEVEPFSRITEGVAVPARLDTRCEGDKQDMPSRKERDEEVQLPVVGDHSVDHGREAGVGEVVRQRAQIAVAQLHLPRRLVGRFTKSPDVTADDQPVDEVAVEPGGAWQSNRIFKARPS
ncbi:MULTISPECIES: hypothetical protein [unclassified Streptomyces]|uniref:hypothetical protein n=1 Tax=unclassified Streptomyces TaxID=2593676 RepID=UPI002366D42E|nr:MULTISPECIES: hypothetical protein [unclassified Streptomyces]MDF3140170.1 hypothetical protein [Streptomyces sp. T21Q-yed]WDF41720.1 hypothetical protein PBV52_35465 [Streptomyces sp. T12]